MVKFRRDSHHYHTIRERLSIILGRDGFGGSAMQPNGVPTTMTKETVESTQANTNSFPESQGFFDIPARLSPPPGIPSTTFSWPPSNFDRGNYQNLNDAVAHPLRVLDNGGTDHSDDFESAVNQLWARTGPHVDPSQFTPFHQVHPQHKDKLSLLQHQFNLDRDRFLRLIHERRHPG